MKSHQKLLIFCTCILISSPLLAQNQPAGTPQTGAVTSAPRSGPGGNIKPVPETGFVKIFDGISLNGWKGDMTRWKVEDGTIVAQTTTENPLLVNTFLIWQGGKPTDFELKLEYRLTGGNSGIQYRSKELLDPPFAMSGYQCDIDANLMFAGMIYEERGRGFLAPRGQANYISPAENGQSAVIGNLASLGIADELKAVIKNNDWNEIHLIVRGNTIVQMFNKRVMSIVIDDDPAGSSHEGLLGLQLHTGEPMKIEFRNIRIKQ